MPRRIALSRFAGLMLALLLHVVVFALVAHLRIGSTPVPVTDDVPPFQLVKIAPPVAPPPPPPPPPINLTPSLAGGSAPAPALAPIAITTPQAHFTVPLPDLNGPATALAMLRALHGTGSGGTSATGETQGQGNSGDAGTGDTANIAGLKVPLGSNPLIMLDVSESTRDVRGYLQNCCTKFFLSNDITNVNGCTGKYTVGGRDRSTDNSDFYEAGYQILNDQPNHNPPAALVMLSDWEDGADADATDAFVAALRARHLKLFLLSVECTPYQGLIDYAKESGGQVVITTRLAIKVLDH